MRRPTLLAVRCSAAALVLTVVVGLHLQPGNVLQLSAQTYYVFPNFGGFNGFGAYPFNSPGYLPGYPTTYLPNPGAYMAPVTQVVNASTTLVSPVAQSAPLPTGNPDITLSAGSSPQPLLPGCTTVHLDGGTGLRVDQELARISPASNVQNISVVHSDGTTTFAYISSGSSMAPMTLIGSGAMVQVICIVGTNTTISAPTSMPSGSPSSSP